MVMVDPGRRSSSRAGTKDLSKELTNDNGKKKRGTNILKRGTNIMVRA